eukprot:1069079_1
MFHNKKVYIVGDHVVLYKRQGIVHYIGESSSSNTIWIGVALESKHRAAERRNWRKNIASSNPSPIETEKQIKHDQIISTNGYMDDIKYIENKHVHDSMDIIFIEASKIKKWFKGTDNKLLSREFRINQKVWIKSIKCKGIIKSMFYHAPKHVRTQVIMKKKRSSKYYIGVLLDKPFGNNSSNKIKYFPCKDRYDYFMKVDRKQLIPSSEYNERLSSDNLSLIIDHVFGGCFNIKDSQLPHELLRLLISFCGAMDGTLNVKENQVYKYSDPCLSTDDYYEYDTVYLGPFSRLIGGKLICIKCFGDLVIDEHAEISASGTVDEHADDREGSITPMLKNSNLTFGMGTFSGKGGGIIKIICFGNVLIRKHALVSANSEDGSWAVSGGTIYIKCETLINHGMIIAMGCNNTGPIWYPDTREYRWSYWLRSSHGRDGRIIIDGKYSEDGSDKPDSSYCGPILMPKQPHLNHKSLSLR